MGYAKFFLTLSLVVFTSAYGEKALKADYVVIGVGTAGAAMAKEMTDDKKTSVIALHSGENLTDDPLIKLSENALFTVVSGLLPSPLYENDVTVPQPDADNRELVWDIALPLGGASSINAGAWCRGTNAIYSQWEALLGPNWSVNRILGIYKDLENFHGTTTNPSTHGYNGPISIRQVQNPSLVSQTFTQAIINATGFPLVLDYNDPNTPIGASSQFQFSQSFPDGTFRVSGATAFLNEDVMTPEGCGVHGRKLRVLFDSFALRTIWKGNKAIGVEYVQNGKTKQVYAKKGVIVCAGLRSSVFLLQSGVGPNSLLSSLGIPVIYDNPNVGQGLADQPQMPLIFTSNPAHTPLEVTNALFDSIAWLPVAGGSVTDPRKFRFAAGNPIPGFTIVLFDMCQNLSRGSVSINSADPLDPPVIDLGEFTNSSDFNAYINGFQTYIAAINTAVNLLDPFYELIYPSPSILSDVSALSDFMRQNVASNQCFQSHCRMAPQNLGGVVDNTGHVYGVQNLIVADDSIVPVPMDGTPMTTAYLIAVNIARLLLGY